MKEIIGLWFIVLAICIIVFSWFIEEEINVKMVHIIIFMIFFSCLEIGVYLLVY